MPPLHQQCEFVQARVDELQAELKTKRARLNKVDALLQAKRQGQADAAAAAAALGAASIGARTPRAGTLPLTPSSRSMKAVHAFFGGGGSRGTPRGSRGIRTPRAAASPRFAGALGAGAVQPQGISGTPRLVGRGHPRSPAAVANSPR